MKIYGISKIIKHPDGFDYVVAYLSSEKLMSNSKIIMAWDRNTLESMRVD